MGWMLPEPFISADALGLIPVGGRGWQLGRCRRLLPEGLGM